MSEREPNAYQARDVVDFYARQTDLTPAERAVFDRVGKDLAGMRLLDIGIGGGRTTRHLACVVRDYVGVDYAEPMVEACRKSFPARPGLAFHVMDAGNMRAFGEDSFDFVFFSWNGIDSVSPEHRHKVLAEVRRVARPGGYFFFSSHNLMHLPDLFRFHGLGRPARWPREARRQWNLRRANEPLAAVMARPQAVVSDGAHEFRLKVCYIRPSAQVAQLERFSFGDVEIIAPDGRPVPFGEADRQAEDMWLNYLCRVRK